MINSATLIKIFGVVQGVGFRPFVWRLAKKNSLNGWVKNSSAGVSIHVEGSLHSLNLFCDELLNNPPPLSKITNSEILPSTLAGYVDFRILSSEENDCGHVLISPDLSVCSECSKEFFELNNPRFMYPFINCTNCGPRFTIINKVPYDRIHTSMSAFPMCPSCLKEYQNAADRRYHAQPNACPICGPQIEILSSNHKKYQGSITELIKNGSILAIKGIGGFHLICDALNKSIIKKLRQRKKRDTKPFAVMFRDLETAKKYCTINSYEAELLQSPASPIVILNKRKPDYIPEEVAPGLSTLGAMLPYTPLHYLLFDETLEVLIMTSANITDEPLIIDNNIAVSKLKQIADYFVLHNRTIVNRCDDSIAKVMHGEVLLTRRARGYVPLPLHLKQNCLPVLACGSDLKNTFCLIQGQQAFLSQHLGDLYNYDNYLQYIETISQFENITSIKPTIIAHDLHPNYQSTSYSLSRADLKAVGIQHHHAHMVSAMAENQLEGTVLGLICDGTGYGTDQAIWGFEFLFGDYKSFSRLAHLKYITIPGGEEAIRKPSRIAAAYLYTCRGAKGLKTAKQYLKDLSVKELNILRFQIDNKVNTSLTSSCGRLFDAISALTGICTNISYEGQAAILLESVSQYRSDQFYNYYLSKEAYPYQIDLYPMLEEIIFDLDKAIPAQIIGAKFHATLVKVMTEVILELSRQTKSRQIIIGGGTFQNRILFTHIKDALRNNGLEVFYNRQIPMNDGGLSLGQAIIASEVIKNVPGRVR